MSDVPPPAVGGEVAAAPLLRGYGFRNESRIQSRIQSRLQSRIQSRIQTPRSQARIDAPNGWGGVGGGGLQEQPRTASTDSEVAQLAATAHRSNSLSGAAAN